MVAFHLIVITELLLLNIIRNPAHEEASICPNSAPQKKRKTAWAREPPGPPGIITFNKAFMDSKNIPALENPADRATSLNSFSLSFVPFNPYSLQTFLRAYLENRSAKKRRHPIKHRPWTGARTLPPPTRRRFQSRKRAHRHRPVPVCRSIRGRTTRPRHLPLITPKSMPISNWVSLPGRRLPR